MRHKKAVLHEPAEALLLPDCPFRVCNNRAESNERDGKEERRKANNKSVKWMRDKRECEVKGEETHTHTQREGKKERISAFLSAACVLNPINCVSNK